MKKLFTIFAGLSFLFVPFFASAAQFAAGKEYTLRSGEQIEGNFYAAGSSVIIEGSVDGDLVAAGGDIIVDGDVAEDALIAGGNITIFGNIGEDIRVAGGNIVIGGTVNGEVIVAGGRVHILSDATLNGDVIVAGGQVYIDGTVEGKIEVRGGNIIIGGTIAGPVNVHAEEEFAVTKTASIAGDISYKAPREIIIQDGADITGKISFTQREVQRDRADRGAIKTFFSFSLFIFKIFTALAVGLALYFFFRRGIQEVVLHAVENFWRDALRGFVLVVMLPVASVIAFITLIGIPFGVLGLLILFGLSLLSCALSGVLFGVFVTKCILKKDASKLTWPMVVGGIVGLSLITCIPLIGWVFGITLFFATFGSLALWLYNRLLAK